MTLWCTAARRLQLKFGSLRLFQKFKEPDYASREALVEESLRSSV